MHIAPVKSKLLALLLVLIAFAGVRATAQESAPTTELKALVTQIQGKLRAGQRSAAELAPELAAFDALRAKYAGQKTDELATITLVHASLYRDVLDDSKRATELLKQVEKDYRGQPIAERATAELAEMERRANAAATLANLIGKPAPEITFNWSTRDGLTKLSDLKGKVVVLDFWATWCGPCIATFPQIRELTTHYKDADVVIVGVTSLQGRVHGLAAQPIDTTSDPKKELSLMTDFIKARQITWTVAFSEQNVFNPEYGVEGIPHMAIVAPDGTLRYNGLHPGAPRVEKLAKIDGLLKEFGKKVP